MDLKLLMVIFSFILSGCAVVVEPKAVKNVTVTMMEPELLPSASLGMKRMDVVRLLDREIATARRTGQGAGELRTIKVRSLDSIEMVEVNGISYQVDTYILSSVKPGETGPPDAVPLIYQNGILIGKGQAEFDALKARALR